MRVDNNNTNNNMHCDNTNINQEEFLRELKEMIKKERDSKLKVRVNGTGEAVNKRGLRWLSLAFI